MEYEGKEWSVEDYGDILEDEWEDEILGRGLEDNDNIRIRGGREGVG